MDNACLVEQCKSGDRNAFGLLYKTYLPAMKKVVSYYIHNSEAEWDILHDGFLIAFSAIDTLNDGNKVEAWLTSIMRNLSLQYLKEESNRRMVPISDCSALEYVEDISNETQAPSLDELIALIDKLPEGYGKVFRLAVLEGLSHEEIGALLGIASHSSSSQLTRARAILRRLIVKYRAGMGVLSIIGIILLLWHGMSRHRDGDKAQDLAIKGNAEQRPVVEAKDAEDVGIVADSVITTSLYKSNISIPKQELTAEVIELKDSVSLDRNVIEVNDTVGRRPWRIGLGSLLPMKTYRMSKQMKSRTGHWHWLTPEILDKTHRTAIGCLTRLCLMSRHLLTKSR